MLGGKPGKTIVASIVYDFKWYAPVLFESWRITLFATLPRGRHASSDTNGDWHMQIDSQCNLRHRL
jgi:hypothetical protein